MSMEEMELLAFRCAGDLEDEEGGGRPLSEAVGGTTSRTLSWSSISDSGIEDTATLVSCSMSGRVRSTGTSASLSSSEMENAIEGR
jgi:hypothetical protein